MRYTVDDIAGTWFGYWLGLTLFVPCVLVFLLRFVFFLRHLRPAATLRGGWAAGVLSGSVVAICVVFLIQMYVREGVSSVLVTSDRLVLEGRWDWQDRTVPFAQISVWSLGTMKENAVGTSLASRYWRKQITLQTMSGFECVVRSKAPGNDETIQRLYDHVQTAVADRGTL